MNFNFGLVAHSLGGHRQSYLDIIRKMFISDGHRCVVFDHWIKSLLHRDPVLFLMIEENFIGYSIAAIFRSLFGFRTAGLLFRGNEASSGDGLRLGVKKKALLILRNISAVSTISIVPFEVRPSIAMLADEWIDDVQLWDLCENEPPLTQLSIEIAKLCYPNKILISLGAQSEGKGFQYFTELQSVIRKSNSDWMFVAVGPVAKDMRCTANVFERNGGILVDRFVNDREFLSLFGIADVIWGVYSPQYDQASGVFGRAFQYQKRVLLRSGSIIIETATRLGVATAGLNYGDHESCLPTLESLLQITPKQSLSREFLRSRSAQKIYSRMIGKPICQ